MANPTTNYSFAMPTNTDLVKDLPADFDIFGQAVDDRIKALNPETTTGDISYRSATANTNTRLAIGTAGQVLTVNSGATAPEWQTAGGTSLIQETVASNLTTLTFGSIPATFSNLVLVWDGTTCSDDSTQFSIRFNNDSGSNYHVKLFSFATAGAVGEDTGTNVIAGDATQIMIRGNPSTLTRQWAGTLELYNYASTTRTKRYDYQSAGYSPAQSANRGGFLIGTYNSLSAISSIDIYRYAGTGTFSNAANTSIRLYGIK
jgi:hypothetical protein